MYETCYVEWDNYVVKNVREFQICLFKVLFVETDKLNLFDTGLDYLFSAFKAHTNYYKKRYLKIFLRYFEIQIELLLGVLNTN